MISLLIAALQQNGPFGNGGGPEAAVLSIILIIFAAMALTGLCIWGVVYYLLFTCFQRIPPQFRLMEPWQVFLLFIPCFGLVWNFFVFHRLSQSYQRYFASIQRYDVGDCGQSIGLAYCICLCVSVFPYVGILTFIAAIVLLILYVVKALSLKGMIPENAQFMPYGQGTFPGQNYPPKGF